MVAKKIAAPIVRELPYNHQVGHELSEDENKELLINYPTVYIIHTKSGAELTVYIGETTNIQQRTIQHLNIDPERRLDWQELDSQKGKKLL